MKGKKQKPNVSSMVKNSIGMMVTGGMGGAVGSYGMGAGIAYTTNETTKKITPKGKKIRRSPFR